MGSTCLATSQLPTFSEFSCYQRGGRLLRVSVLARVERLLLVLGLAAELPRLAALLRLAALPQAVAVVAVVVVVAVVAVVVAVAVAAVVERKEAGSGSGSREAPSLGSSRGKRRGNF